MSMMTNNYKLDLTPGVVPLVIFVSQYDTKTRVLRFTLVDKTGAAISYGDSDDVSAAIRGTKPDGMGFDYAASVSISSSGIATVTVTLTEQMTAVAGRVPCEIYLYKGEPATTTTPASNDFEQLATANFILHVERAALDKDTLKSDSEIRQLIDVVDRTDELLAAAQDIEDAYETYSNKAVFYAEAQSLTAAQQAQARTNIDAVSGIDERLLVNIIKGTTQTPVFSNGAIQSVLHRDGGGNVVRTDTFNLSGDPMVETRTLATGERLTISTDLTTLASTITYTPAS